MNHPVKRVLVGGFADMGSSEETLEMLVHTTVWPVLRVFLEVFKLSRISIFTIYVNPP